MQRREVRFRGYVQGVGFRATTRQIAQRYQVTGYVCNRDDGGVDVVVEGETQEIARFLADVRRTMADYVRDSQETTAAATGEFSRFGIRI
jgi:acylphosphatase